MRVKETYKISIGSFVRIKYDNGLLDGILVENEKDSIDVKVFFPMDDTLDEVYRDQIYKVGKRIELNFDNSGLVD